jgi:hypothetical protein
VETYKFLFAMDPFALVDEHICTAQTNVFAGSSGAAESDAISSGKSR